MKKRAAIPWILLLLSVSVVLGVRLPAGDLQTEPAEAQVGAGDRVASPAAETDAPSAIGPAVFPHSEHAQDMGIECVVCHHETDAAPLTIPHEDYFKDFWIDCKICHHEPGANALSPQDCSTCHHARGTDIADETLSAKVVIHKNCWSCHDVGTGAAASAACESCHAAGS